ncbi:MAG: ribonuclease, partial [Thermoleophilaceae bacterium]|nr:ribonuclease [Thermoleophilaceae bacterium]
CDGEGVVLSEETVAIEVERKLRDLVAERPEPEAFLIQVHPRVSNLLINGPGRPLLDLERELGRHFHFEGSEALPIDYFAVAMEGSSSDVEDRALPFREGEEVHVTIEEPHMYEEDDAVAKVDGYVISVTGAGSLIGEKRLVRIDSVSRSAATASLVGGPPPPKANGGGDTGGDGGGDSGGGSGGDGEEAPRRRRGRRGGRGRRRTPAEATD